jgi:hypothetical protein
MSLPRRCPSARHRLPPSPAASVRTSPHPLDGRCGLPPGPSPALAALVYELLDAHADTADLASHLELDREWLAHLDYLRALRREGRRVLAELAVKHPL